MSQSYDHHLGMDRPITRRDFLNGVSVAVTGSILGTRWIPAFGSQEPAPQTSGEYYPPALTGLRGSHVGSFEAAHQLRDAGLSSFGAATDTGEAYDLVVVGGGISGLAAAYFFRKATGPSAKILVLDNHDDFGGHAKRNEFHHGDRLLLMNGGTVNIEDFTAYGEAAQGLIRELGIEVERYPEFLEEELYSSLGLSPGVFFDEETFGVDRLVVHESVLGWRGFLAKAPVSEKARKDIARLYEERVDYLPNLSQDEKKAALRGMTYRDFLTEIAKVHANAIPFFQTRSNGYWAIGIDVLPAWATRPPAIRGLRVWAFQSKAKTGSISAFRTAMPPSHDFWYGA